MNDLSNNYSLTKWVKNLSFNLRVDLSLRNIKLLLKLSSFIIIFFYLINLSQNQRIIADKNFDEKQLIISEDTNIEVKEVRENKVIVLSKKMNWSSIIFIIISISFIILIQKNKTENDQH
ncbi:hypothetical protein LNTAR_04186 [Lentisphaera araneosa HTCC2155]|jgi:hypothetical protein|uniref:Uncharacterized protein n=1 Tax=Lentisphaera araneosa HTCC2155 TaxID=313628 RepID=A6DTY3_9BACT|nr:hypothetical protein [Lentisphaera araneosa]EDM24899.1 hypothetical protein LNTAR_04186 [Lentisphaera araneosa HTCC2155]